jgi:hypothetical protein
MSKLHTVYTLFDHFLFSIFLVLPLVHINSLIISCLICSFQAPSILLDTPFSCCPNFFLHRYECNLTLIQIFNLNHSLFKADSRQTDRQTAKLLIFEHVLCLDQYLHTCVTWLISQLLLKSVRRLAFMKTN